MKRTILFTGCTVLAALTCLLVLVSVTDMPNDEKNGFNRRWLTWEVRLERSYRLPFTAERLFGSGDHLYLSGPSHLQVYRLHNNLHIKDTLRLDVNRQLRPPVVFFADADRIYIHEYNSGQLFIQNTGAKFVDSVRLSSGPFVKSIQLSDSIAVIRGFTQGSTRPVFMRIDLRNGRRYQSDLLSEVADAGFSTDGILCSNNSKDRLLYIPYFQNGIYCMDSDMKVCYTQHTIDTVFNNVIAVKNRGAGEWQKLYASAPREKVNKRAFANDRILFIESNLRADNEKEATFREYPVLDAYRIEDGHYAGSFYIPVNKQKVLSYYMNAGTLYVLLKDRVLSFAIKSR